MRASCVCKKKNECKREEELKRFNNYKEVGHYMQLMMALQKRTIIKRSRHSSITLIRVNRRHCTYLLLQFGLRCKQHFC